MRANIYLILFFLLFVFLTSFSQTGRGTGNYSGGHDSLDFDGTNENSYNFEKPAEECKIRVLDVFGEATGTYLVKKIGSVCGLKDTIIGTKTGLLKRGYKLVPGTEVTLGGNGWTDESGHHQIDVLSLRNENGTDIMLTYSARILIKKDCNIHVYSGNVEVSGEYDVSTNRTSVSHKKTQYSLDVAGDGDNAYDVVKVYEGQVDVSAKKDSLVKSTSDKGAQIKQLTADYMSKKITMEEYNAKLAELTKNVTETANDIGKVVTLTAGYQCTVDSKGVISDAAPFEITGNEWFNQSYLKSSGK